MLVKTFPSRRAASLVLLAAVLAAPGCSAPPGPTTGPAPYGAEYPTGHVHALAREASTGKLLLATHEGLFEVTDQSIEKIGPALDLMGFTIADTNHYYASGHPGAGSDLPNPMGIIHSEDGGKTWAPMSRNGQSDFHALTVTRSGITGFDGSLRQSPDGRNWSTASTSIKPANLAGTPYTPVVLGTTEAGVQRSTDGGTTWELPTGSPTLLFTAFAGAETAAGVSPEGRIYVSADAGESWESKGEISGTPFAIAAGEEDGELRIWLATAKGIEYSTDGGKGFSLLVGGQR